MQVVCIPVSVVGTWEAHAMLSILKWFSRHHLDVALNEQYGRLGMQALDVADVFSSPLQQIEPLIRAYMGPS